MKRDGPGGTPDSDDTTNPEGNTEPTGDGEDTQDGEPNVERFTHSDLACKIVRTNLGHWCGYVRRPEDAEPIRWTSDYDSKHDDVIDAEVDVWGGITYGPDDDGWVGFDDAHARDLVDYREADDARGAVRLETKRLAEQIQELREENQAVTDGGLDAETVIGTVDPGDVVVVAGSPYRVVDVEADEDDGVLRLYDLVERTETVKAAGAGDVDVYLHRSESDAIQGWVQEEREQRDAGDDQEDDVDRGDGVETDGGVDWGLEELRDVDPEAIAAEQGLDEDGVRMHTDLVERVVWAVNEDDVDVQEAQAAVESLAEDLQEPAGVPDEWILRHRFGIVPGEDVDDDPGIVSRVLGWFR